jgi:hypothetical protein
MPAVHRIDHVNIVTDAPGPLATKLSEALGLPFSSPLASLPPFDFAILAAGNVTIEVLRFGSRRRIPAAPTHAQLAAIVFDTEDLDATLAELRRAEIPHLAPLVFSGEPTRLPAYDEFRRSPGDPNWRVTIVDGVLTDKLVSKRVSARPVAGSSPRAVTTARAMGRLAGSARLGRLAAPIFDPGPQFLAVCEWGHDEVGAGRPTNDGSPRARAAGLASGG